jgi:hypothetical protein
MNFRVEGKVKISSPVKRFLVFAQTITSRKAKRTSINQQAYVITNVDRHIQESAAFQFSVHHDLTNEMDLKKICFQKLLTLQLSLN